MAKTIENLFALLHYSVNTLIILLFIALFKKIRLEKGFLVITIYCLIDSVLNVAVNNVRLSYSWNLYIWATFTFIEYLTFTFFIWRSIKHPFVKRMIVYISGGFILFTTIYNIATNFRSIDSIPIGVETILILIFSFYFLYEQMNDTNNLFIYSKYQFWVIIGFMIYLAGSFFIYILANVMGVGLLKQYWMMTNVFYAIMIVLIAISFFIYSKKSKPNIQRNLRPYLN